MPDTQCGRDTALRAPGSIVGIFKQKDVNDGRALVITIMHTPRTILHRWREEGALGALMPDILYRSPPGDRELFFWASRHVVPAASYSQTL
jgi:hypothetical protein